MFKKSRSKRANRNAVTAAQVPPTAAAAIAAMQAANGNTQEGRLAAGAAAAALRSHTSSPVNVSDVQTRRMVRRASITSGTSDTSYLHGQVPMSRTGSISSMTSRTFRSPSPHGQKPAADGAAPPVPAIPRSGATSPNSITSRTFRRPASTEPNAGRMTSPTPQTGLRNMSVDAATRNRPGAINTSDLGDIEARNASRNSINFSRPMSPDNRPLSPSPTSPTAQARGGYSSPLSKYELDELEYQYQDVANKPVRRTKGLGGDEGSHLAAGTMGVRAHGSAVDRSAARPKRMPLPRRISEEPEEEEFEDVFDPHTRTMIKRRKPGYKPKAVAVHPPPAAARPQAQPAAPSAPQQPPARAQSSATPVLPTPEPKSRDVSASPARKARFSLRPEENTVHEPARSLTPTKSALRKSPSPRGISPADPGSKRASWNQPGFTPSEASETPSQMSDDRSKRRSVRVSFDDRPTIVGTSAAPAVTDSPVVMSPQHDKKKNWFGLRKNKAQAEEVDDGLTPMPTLPSFGSIRDRRPNSEEEEAEPAAGVLGIPGVALTTGEKTPSEAGSHVDEVDRIDRHNAPPVPALPERSEGRVNGSVKKLKSGDVPIIEVIPGTPGIEKALEDPLSGGNDAKTPSPVAEASPAVVGIAELEPEAAAAAHDPDTPAVGHVAEAIQKQTEPTKKDSDSQDSHYSDAAEEASEGDGFGSINAIVESPVMGPESPKKKMAESLPPLTEGPPPEIAPVPAAEADRGAEATTFREAIAEEPAAAVSVQDTPGESPTSGQAVAMEAAPAGRKPAVESVTYNPRRLGSGSSSRDASPSAPVRFAARDPNRRPRLARRYSSDSDDDGRQASQTAHLPTVAQTPRQSSQAQAGSTVPPVDETPPKQIAQDPTAASVPSSTTGTPVHAGSERKPLKSALKQTNRMSMPPEAVPAAQPRGTLQRKARPASTAGTPAQPQQSEAVMLAQAMLKVQQNRAKEAKAREADVQATLDRARVMAGGAPPPKKANQHALLSKSRRRGSDASESSFKRGGPASVTSEGGRVSMRRSMRANNAPAARPQSMRVDSFRGARPASMIVGGGGGGGGGFAAHSMRQPSRDPSPTRSILSFRKPKRASSVQAPTSRRRAAAASRFDDSSDDDDGPAMPATLSRFEQRRATMRPVRGIPQRTAEVDSSDLDSDAEPHVPAPAKSAAQDDYLMELARQRLGIQARPDVPEMNDDDRHGQSNLVAAFAENKAAASPTTTPEKSKRRSIFGTLSRRKNQGKVAKDQEDSIARRDTPLERTTLQRKNTGDAAPERPGNSRKNTAERAAALRDQVDPNSWPLPESPTVAERPQTSDDSPTDGPQERPPNRRMFSSESAPVYGRAGKKKRFPFLRRAFGLHD